jgi:hypothetical protein
MRREEKMTKDQAIEACAKAMLRRRGQREEQWKESAQQLDLAKDLVAALEAIGLLTPPAEDRRQSHG